MGERECEEFEEEKALQNCRNDECFLFVVRYKRNSLLTNEYFSGIFFLSSLVYLFLFFFLWLPLLYPLLNGLLFFISIFLFLTQ